MSNNLGIDRIIGTPTEREIVDGIRKLVFPMPLCPIRQLILKRQLQIGALYIFKVNNGNIL